MNNHMNPIGLSAVVGFARQNPRFDFMGITMWESDNRWFAHAGIVVIDGQLVCIGKQVGADSAIDVLTAIALVIDSEFVNRGHLSTLGD
jgi:hypothetical protein